MKEKGPWVRRINAHIMFLSKFETGTKMDLNTVNIVKIPHISFGGKFALL